MTAFYFIIRTKINLLLQLVVLACLVAATSAGLLPTAQISYAAPQQIVHAAPAAYQAQVAYPAPVAYSAPIGYSGPVTKVVAPLTKVITPVQKIEEYNTHPQYSYSYDVQDSVTGDSKSQQESRDGDVVRGSYSVVDPDGIKRTVEYTADDHNGFNAVVHKEPIGHVAKVAAYSTAPVSYAPAPVAYSGPVYHH